MQATLPQPITEEDRFDRLRRIAWWDQTRLRAARILVIGAGALGNEILKNLALLGVGNILVADLDVIENSNLSRSVLYRERDHGRRKAEVAAERVKDIYPETNVHWFHGDVVYELGLGAYAWADLVIAGVDNREARLHINRSCWKTGVPWIDGATEVLQGVVRVFIPPDGPCYECTLSEADREILKQRERCGGLRPDEIEQGRTPTTPTTASIIAALESQEAIKLLHGLEVLAGRGMIFNGLSYDTYLVSYQADPECVSHETHEEIIKLDRASWQTTLRALLAEAHSRLGAGAILEFNHELLIAFHCPNCDTSEAVFKPLGATLESAARCPACVQPRRPESVRIVTGAEAFLDRTLAEMGMPPYDIVGARKGFSQIGFELSGDAPSVLGPLHWQ